FEAAAANFEAACRHGIDARFEWPRRGRLGGTTEVDAAVLVRDELLPLAEAGLDAWGVEPADRDFYLGVIEERCRRRVNGASWQAATFHRALEAGMSREAALAATTRRYVELMREGDPVHLWPVGLPEPVPLG
ncbi:glutamate--cysteine ligase, partial [Streptomyces violaceoruber]